MDRMFFFRFSMGALIAAGGIYLYVKYKQKGRKALAHIGGTVIGDKMGAKAGYAIAGPGGALMGGLAGAMVGAIAVEEFYDKKGTAAIECKKPDTTVRKRKQTRINTQQVQST